MHLSFKHCEGAQEIMVRHREQGEKIQLTSDDCLDLHALLQTGNWNFSLVILLVPSALHH